MQQLLTVGQLARATGVSAKTIRYYEQVGVLPTPRRSPSGYRHYARRDVHRLLFVRRARALGLSLKNLKTLTVEVDNRRCGTMQPQLSNLVQAQLQTVQQRIAEFQLLRRQLEQVLQQLSTTTLTDAAEGCRCLDHDAAPRESSSPSCTSILGEESMETQNAMEAMTALTTPSGAHDGHCGCGCGCALPLTQLSDSQKTAEPIRNEEGEPHE